MYGYLRNVTFFVQARFYRWFFNIQRTALQVLALLAILIKHDKEDENE